MKKINCKDLKVRTKKYKKYYYCNRKKEEVDLKDCYNCNNKEYKKAKPIKKVSKKRKTVSEETYDIVFKRCNGRCQICGTTENLSYHHVLFRSERPDLIDDPRNGIMLCNEFANDCHKGKAHKNKKYWQPKLIELAATGLDKI